MAERIVVGRERKSPDLIEKEAYAKGFEAGERAGYETGMRKAAVQTDKLMRLVESLLGAKEEMMRECGEQMLLLSFSISERILRREPAIRPDSLLPVLKDAIGAAYDSERVVVRVSPADFAFLNGNEDFKREIELSGKKAYFEADGSVSPGGCVVFSESREIDATIETQLDQIYSAIENEERAGCADMSVSQQVG
jgi:flagellar assembly protein FliH